MKISIDIEMLQMEKTNPDKKDKVLEIKGITKKFRGIIANDNINLVLKYGEIHSILGENGAGKTTLMNILYGLYQPDSGEIWVHGKKVNIKSPKDAISLGIGMVHQHTKLINTLTVLDNIILGAEPMKWLVIDRKLAEKKIIELQQKFNLEVNLTSKPFQITTCAKQKVEILKVLFRGARILIMDEATAMLTPQEKGILIQSLKRMAKEGHISIFFITHKLPEIMDASDRVTILRKGKIIDTLAVKEIRDLEDLAYKMLGKKIMLRVKRRPSKQGDKILEIEKIKAVNDKGTLVLNELSLFMRAGEILGIAGVSGNGQSELMDVIMGLRMPIAGKVLCKGENITNVSCAERRKRKFAYIPEDRMRAGLISNLTVSENAVVGTHWDPKFTHRGFLNRTAINDHAARLVTEFNIDTPDIGKEAGKLSGGNMQKLLLARELSRDPEIILADKPSTGLDVNSTTFIRQLLMKEKEKGKAILLISEDLDEIMMMSDRVSIIYEGKILKTMLIEEVTIDEIGLFMMGKC